MPLRSRVQAIAFRSLYAVGGWIYDPTVTLLFGAAWQEWREVAAGRITTGPVLDLGCGTGRLLPAFRERGLVSVGLDRSRSMLRRARQERGSHQYLVRGDTLQLPFRSGAFGGCIASFPANFVTSPITQAEVARVLKSGGTFVILLGGTVERWSIWRAPVRAALRLFYGRQPADQERLQLRLSHPDLPGRLETIRTKHGSALFWVASCGPGTAWSG